MLGSLQLGRIRESGVCLTVQRGREFLVRVAWSLTSAIGVELSHLRQRSKSVSMMCPSDRIKTFSGFRSR